MKQNPDLLVTRRVNFVHGVRLPALDRAEAEIDRLNRTLDLACSKLAEVTKTNMDLNRMLDAACDGLKLKNDELARLKAAAA